MSRFQLRLLGSFQLLQNAGQATGFRSEKERALLAYLSIEASRPHPREALAGLFWPEVPDDTAHNNLRVTLHRLRQVLGDAGSAQPVLEVSRDAVQLAQPGQLWIDVSAFQELLSKTEQHPHEKLATCPECMASYAEAAALYRGEFLQGVYPTNSDPFLEFPAKREPCTDRPCKALFWHHQRGISTWP
jgi:DNA-binding SARP family transcriptional activator